MDYEVKRKLVDLARDRRDGLSDQKGAEYTKTGGAYKEGGDVLTNFKKNAERFGQNPFTVLGIYLGKHFDAVEHFIKDLNEVESYEEAVALSLSGEGIISRLDDVANYVDLLEALLFEYELHPFSIQVDVPEDTVAEILTEEEEIFPQDELAEEVEEAAASELANFVGPESPFKASREVGNG